MAEEKKGFFKRLVSGPLTQQSNPTSDDPLIFKTFYALPARIRR